MKGGEYWGDMRPTTWSRHLDQLKKGDGGVSNVSEERATVIKLEKD